MAHVPNITLNTGAQLPALGFGTYKIPDGEAAEAVETALEIGYRSIDTAALYDNERGVGKGIAAGGLPRDEVFVTTKLWPSDFGDPLAALDVSLEKLGLDAVDLYLLHWPAPATDAYLTTWETLQTALADGRVKALGVSNFLPENLARLAEVGGATPAVNQIELHPYLRNAANEAANTERGIVTEAWSPIGRGRPFDDAAVADAAAAHGVSPARVLLRWHLQAGRVAIPKSVTPSRIRENLDITGFELTAAEVAAIDALDRGTRIGPDPAVFNG